MCYIFYLPRAYDASACGTVVFLFFFLLFFFFKENKPCAVSCESSARQTIHMKCQVLFILKK